MTAAVLATYPTPRCPRYETLDAWRGLACLMVVIYHATLITHYVRGEASSGLASYIITWTHFLNVGVPMFFVISGYCISAAADTARRRENSVRSYFWRRFRRIFPPLWIMIVLAIVLFLAVDVVLWPGLLSDAPWPQLRPWWFSPWQWVGNLTLTETWRHYLIGNQRGHFPGQAWTLCYEEQFYALTGLMLLLASRRFFSVAAVLTVGVLATMFVCHAYGITTEGFFFDGNWLTFAAGIVVYYRVNYAGPALGWTLSIMLAVAAALTWVTAAPIPGGSTAFVFALVLSLTHRFDSRMARARLVAPLTFCGQMCYSLYLVHQLPVKAISNGFYQSGFVSELFTLLVTVPLCVTVSVLLGRFFYLGVERRFLNSPKRAPASTELGTTTGDVYNSPATKRGGPQESHQPSSGFYALPLSSPDDHAAAPLFSSESPCREVS